MRVFRKKQMQAAEEESVFVTMTDLTISFLLIVMILLAYVASQLNEDTVPAERYNQAKNELEETKRERNDLQDQVNDLLIQIEYLKERISNLQSDLVRASSERDAAIRERDRLREQMERLAAEMERLRLELSEAMDEIARLRAKLERRQVNRIEEYMLDAAKQRTSLLTLLKQELENRIKIPGLKIEINLEIGTLSFTSERLFKIDSEEFEGLFKFDEFELEGRKLKIVQDLGELLDKNIACHTLGKRSSRGPDCKSGNALIETIQIEGHTDSDGGRDHNLWLSTMRASSTFSAIEDSAPSILEHKNANCEPVMSVAGYGSMRPARPNDTIKGKAANRRIDLRIIMYAPNTIKEFERIRRGLVDMTPKEKCLDPS